MNTRPDTETAGEPAPRNAIDRFFEITERGSSVPAEIRGGIVTFVTMAYIVILNPIILSGGTDVAGENLGFAQVAAVTALTAGVMTILFGVVARLPFAFAAGLGINSFLAVSVVGQVTWAEAMGLVLINGLIIVVLAATACGASSSRPCRCRSSSRSRSASACSSRSSDSSTPDS
ncbi:hypothetical protein GCM10025870_05940 [Agromyces marinus]|uniref:Permease family protein n=1 Tax=Agromyces marinus TaxID=1389020 RepID=A0ABN6YBX4_9MICO|nr:hypothetical protein GCM10025870_05940 [Agromyces marinus]